MRGVRAPQPQRRRNKPSDATLPTTTEEPVQDTDAELFYQVEHRLTNHLIKFLIFRNERKHFVKKMIVTIFNTNHK